MAKKNVDFTAGTTNRVYEQIAEATQETPEEQETQEKAQEHKKRYKDRKEYTQEEAELFISTFKTSGRKGLKLPRINVAFSPENYEYIRTMARVRGESYTEFINWLIRTHKDENLDTYKKAHEFIDNM